MNLKILLVLFFCNSVIVNSQIEKIGTKAFIEKTISKKEYKIDLFEKEISTNKYYHSLFLNKAVRFKSFIDLQDYSSNFLEINCTEKSNEIKFLNTKIKNTYNNGLQNAQFIFDLILQKKPSLLDDYKKIFNQQKDIISSFNNNSNKNCFNAYNELKLRNQGFFYDENNGSNIISFNYILNPEGEIFDNYIQEFSSINSVFDDRYFFKVDLPKTWVAKQKKDFNNSSTLGFFEPFEKFLNANISISSKELMTNVEMKSKNITDEILIDFIYEDNKTLKKILSLFNSKINEDKIYCTIYNNGNFKMILYNNKSNLYNLTQNDIFKGQELESLGALLVKNGKIINLNCGAVNDGFNTFDYYSNLFFKVITSIKIRESQKNIIYLIEENNMNFISLNFKNLNYKFVLDTGATDVVINKVVLDELLFNGILSSENYINDSLVQIADGTILNCQNWLIPEIQISKYKIKNIVVSVIDSEKGFLLFGMNGLKKLNIKNLNLSENEIEILE